MNFPEFTEEQIAELKKNPYVYKVTSTHLFFTAEFKQIAYDKLQEGADMSDILTAHGFDVDVLTEARIKSIPPRLKREYKKNNGIFNQGKGPTVYSQALINLTYEERKERKRKSDKKGVRRYEKTHYDSFNLRLPVNFKKLIEKTAKERKTSQNALVFTAICEYLGIPVQDLNKPYEGNIEE